VDARLAQACRRSTERKELPVSDVHAVEGGQSHVWAQGGPKGMGPLRHVLDAVSDLLHVDSKDLMQDLRSGKSLADVATGADVSRDDLLAAVTQALSGGPGPAGADPSAIAQQLVDRKGFPGQRHGHGQHHAVDFQHAISQLSDSLGVSANDLISSLQSGTSLEDLAKEHGVSQDELATLFGQGQLVDTTA
jgi:hypothetical protein